MYYEKRQLWLTALLAIFGGMLLHRLWAWFPNPAAALVSVCRESLWEHVKIIYWPFLAGALWLSRGRPKGLRPWLLVLPIQCGLMLCLSACWHLLLGGGPAWVDIALYAGVMLLGFWLAPRFSGPFEGTKWVLPVLLTVLLGLLTVLFTLEPPQGAIFADLGAARSWYQLPC